MKKIHTLLLFAPLALVACVNPGTSSEEAPATREASGSTDSGAVAAPMHGWVESNG